MNGKATDAGQAPTHSWNRQQVARVTRNSIVAHGLSLAMVLLIVLLSGSYLNRFFRGPLAPTDRELTQIIANRGNRSLISYVELHDRPMLDTGWQEVMTSDGKPYSTFLYFLTPVGDRYLLVLARSAIDGKHLVGPLGPLRPEDQKVINATIRTKPEFQGKVLPVLLNSVAAFNVWGYVLLTVLVPWAVFSLYRLTRAIGLKVNPDDHSITRQFADATTPFGLPSNIDDEMSRQTIVQLGKATLTESWLVRPTLFGVKSVRLADVVWIYHLSRPSESFAVFGLRNRQLAPIPLKFTHTASLVECVSQKIPWAISGYNDDLMKIWRNQPDQMIATVDAERARRIGSVNR